ncbi:MAG: PaaI family thioesterase [Pseudomonadales bacterium]|nr:PaaI family thioesterase [Pseudomonadales bacterium]
MTNDEMSVLIRKHLPPAIKLIGGDIIEIDQEAGEVQMSFIIGEEFCHSKVIVQGGYVSAMLDACMAHAASTHSGLTKSASTLELKVSFLGASNPGTFRGVGRVVRMGRSIAYTEASLFNEAEVEVARSSSTVKLIPSKPRDS